MAPPKPEEHPEEPAETNESVINLFGETPPAEVPPTETEIPEATEETGNEENGSLTF
jgi:hypothetical protein